MNTIKKIRSNIVWMFWIQLLTENNCHHYDGWGHGSTCISGLRTDNPNFLTDFSMMISSLNQNHHTRIHNQCNRHQPSLTPWQPNHRRISPIRFTPKLRYHNSRHDDNGVLFFVNSKKTFIIVNYKKKLKVRKRRNQTIHNPVKSYL